MDFKTSPACASDLLREQSMKEPNHLTGDTNPCSGCGKDHDSWECWNNGNRPCEIENCETCLPSDHQYKLENVYKGFQDSLDKLKALGV